MVSKPSFVVSTYSYIPINEINKFSLVNFSMYKYCFNEQLVPFIAILTTTTTLLLWKKTWAWNGERKRSSILICWPINWIAHMNLQPAVLQKFTLWHSGEHLPQKSTPFLICWLCICCPLPKPHLCFLPIACNTHTPTLCLLTGNRKWEKFTFINMEESVWQPLCRSSARVYREKRESNLWKDVIRKWPQQQLWRFALPHWSDVLLYSRAAVSKPFWWCIPIIKTILSMPSKCWYVYLFSNCIHFLLY